MSCLDTEREMVESEKSVSQVQKETYDHYVFAETVGMKDLKVRRIIQQMIGNKRCKILDVGCGDGNLLQPFCELHECYGVDISEAQLKKARAKKLRAFRVNIETKKLPFQNDFFDLVICSETIEHLLEIDNLFLEINRTLKPKGIFILTFPNVNQPVSWLIQVALDLTPVYSARYKSPHVRDYTLRIIRTILTAYGFKILKATGTYVYPFKGKFSQWLAENFPRLSEKIIVVSEKEKKIRYPQSQKIVWNILELATRPRRGLLWAFPY